MSDLHDADDLTRDVEHLERRLSEPREDVVQAMRRLEGDLLLLGAGGKMGPTLARMARRATDAAGIDRRIIGVGRRATPELRSALAAQRIQWIDCDLLDRRQLEGLPDAANVIYMPALKFDATGREPLAWATNTYLPGMVCERFRRSRIAAFSTGNVYGMVPVDRGGSVESDPLRPDGDYAASCVGRERIFSHFSEALEIPVTLLRLNYANELRYGVLVDLARQVLAAEAIDLTMGYFNAIWQGDASAMTLRALEHAATPALAVNVAGPERTSVREVAEEFSRLLGRPVTFSGSEAPDALLSNGWLGYELLGRPGVPVDQMVHWIADWLLRGGPTLDKPTHFQTRDGKF
ncbi:MAG: NAD(P)-dependent oxidoreductase [Pirellulales bacterium]|nr:NAD(P)-dependent oxidoreductase [Pirellulales bacterium]